jgi:hypothetical protein
VGSRGRDGITGLTEALEALGLEGEEVALSGRWIELRGERFPVYVAEVAFGAGYYTWCGGPDERRVEFHLDPTEAIRSGLRRASRY